MYQFNDSEKELLSKALYQFGESAQVDKCIEEMAELTKALLKYRYKTNYSNFKDVQEELADLIIMINQMYLMFELNTLQNSFEGIDYMIQNKMERLEGLVNE
jgi:NTP pyrophosphatase (non-canonical NTP hydrolase)